MLSGLVCTVSWWFGDIIPEDARGDVASAADGDHEVGLEVIEDLVRGFLAQLVHLWGGGLLAVFFVLCLLLRVAQGFDCRGRMYTIRVKSLGSLSIIAAWRDTSLAS